MKKLLKKYLIIAIISIVLLACVLFYREYSCVEVLSQEPVMSSHGYKVWFGPTLQSFNHKGERICIPPGWEPIGHAEKKYSWARYPEGASGVLIHSNDFESQTVVTENNAYELNIVYLKSMRSVLAEEYIETITKAFNRVGALFPKTKEQLQLNTVLITVGVAGDGNEFETSVYPDPSLEMSVFVRDIDHKRAEELFIHAVAHLHNRYREDLIGYQNTQSPIPNEDWQEMEATWIEVVFRSSNEGRIRRLSELYDVHNAIETNTFSESLIFPFSEPELFDAVAVQNVVIPPNSDYSDYQYGHYVLAPLVMTAIEGLLQEYKTGIDVISMLTRLHTGESISFLDDLKIVLPEHEMFRIKSWMSGEETIPVRLISSATTYYERVE